MFQEFFNDIKNFSIQWVLAPAIALKKFESPSSLQFPKWEFILECGDSFPHIFLHSQEHEMWFFGFNLGACFCKPFFGCEPKVRVVTSNFYPLYSWRKKWMNNSPHSSTFISHVSNQSSSATYNFPSFYG